MRVVFVGIVLLNAGCLGPAIGVATGLVSHQLCSATFVAGLDSEAYYDESVSPVLGPASMMVSHSIDRQQRAVTASLWGMREVRAVYRDGAGCVVMHQGAEPAVVQALPMRSSDDEPTIVAPNAALAAALEHAFAETEPRRNTKAVVIMHDGAIIAERYASGIGPRTPLPGWSLTKSVINALVGIVVRDGKLDVDAPAPVDAWADDTRRLITPNNLLRMNSGLDLGDSLNASFWSAFDTSARAVFVERDPSAFASSAAASYPPGEHWQYANGNTLILSRLIRDAVGGDADALLRFCHGELFDKLAMHDAVLELDATGTPIGSSHMWASARDWARFGMLYLDDGVHGGERILPEGWVDYSARLTRGAEDIGYGAGFWTNQGNGAGPLKRIADGMPSDTFMGRGAFGQFLIIVPSRRLVIVKLGTAFTKHGDIAATTRLVAETIAAL